MTRVLVLSDTHVLQGKDHTSDGARSQDEGVELLDCLSLYTRDADLILHAGDHTGVDFFRELERLGSVIAVHGNMDAAALQQKLPERAIFDCEGIRIGLLHGWGAPGDLPERVHRSLADQRLDVIVFGHSHQALQEVIEGVLLFNPGSPSIPRSSERTLGWLEIHRGRVNPHHVTLP